MKYILRRKKIILILVILFLFIAIPRIIFPDLDHGDEFSDANVLNAGENFVKFGFIKCRFLPMYEPNLDVPQNLYTHYPPLSEIINGLLRIIFKTNSLTFFRGVALFFAFLNLIFWYLFIKRFSNSYIIGILAFLFYLTNPLFILGMDSLHQLSYSDFLRSLILFIFMIMLNSHIKKKKVLFFCSLWVLIMLESLVTFEYIIYLSLFFILFPVFFKESKKVLSKKLIFGLLLASVVGFLIHFVQNIWYFGSFSLAFNDLKTIAIQRVIQSQDAPPMNFMIWLQYVMLRNLSLVFLFNYFTLFLGIFCAYLLYQKLSSETKKQIGSLYRLFLLFIICGISWYIIFPSHSWAHTFLLFLARHLLPAAAVGFTIFIYIILTFIKENLKVQFYPKIFSILLMMVILFIGVIKSELPVTPEKIKMAQEFIKFKNCLLRLKEISQEKDKIGVNYYRFPFMRYYTNRHFLNISDKSSLENLTALPKYFILIPYDNQIAQELFEFLKQRYVLLWQCNSLRFPGIFFKIKE